MKKKIAILSMMLCILLSLSGCGPSKVAVTIKPGLYKYTPLMSSAQGIPLTVQFEDDKAPAKAKYVWSTEQGQFLGDGKLLGKNTSIVHEEILWVADLLEKVKPGIFTVKVTVVDPDTDKNLGTSEIKIELREDGFYYLK